MKGGENVLIPALKVAIFKSPVVTRIALYKELSLHLAAAAADSRGDNPSETRCKLNFKLANSPAFQCRIDWSTGRELNPRILVLQTSALATSPPVPLVKSVPLSALGAEFRIFPTSQSETWGTRNISEG